MKKAKHLILSVLSVLLIVTGVPLQSVSAAADYVTATKTVSPSVITEGGEVDVTLSIQGTPDVTVVKPNDVLLVIDRSGSMSSENRMPAAKTAAKEFIDMLDLTKHKVGIIDYSASANSFPLSSDKDALKAYVDKLSASGSTATGDAINLSIQELANHRTDAQPVVVLMTDGDATVGGDGLTAYNYALKKANEAKEAGIVFYTVALLGKSDNPDSSGPNNLLKEMATTSNHHHYVLGSDGLSAVYERIKNEIGMASAYEVVLNDVISDEFELVPGSTDNNIPKPTIDGNKLTWNFLELKNDTLTFSYKIKHKKGSYIGDLPISTVNSLISYKDYAGAKRTYKITSPIVKVKYPAPIITSADPVKSHINGGQLVTIEGEYFRKGVKVQFGSVYGNDVQFINENKITVLAPANSQGQTQLMVINDDGQRATTDFNYYADPVIKSITPNNGFITGGNVILIQGSYFLDGAKVKFGDVYSSDVTFVNETYMKVVLPATDVPKVVDVTLENPDGTNAVLPQAFTYNELPKVKVDSISPNSGIVTGGEQVLLSGSMFEVGAKVYFNNIESTNYVYHSDTKMTVTTPPSSVEGTFDVKVVNPNGDEFIVANGYTYLPVPPPPAPIVTKTINKTGYTTGGETVYVDGEHFVSGAQVWFNNEQITTTRYINEYRLSIVTPSWLNAESVAVKVVNPDGQEGVLANGYTYELPPEKPAPKISSLSPVSGPQDGGTTVYINGENFENGSVISIGGIQTKTSYVSENRLRITMPKASVPGSVDVTVTNLNNKSDTLTNGYEYLAPPPAPSPSITQISPNNGEMQGGNNVYVDGENFQVGAKVIWNNVAIESTLISDMRIRVKVPSSTTAGVVEVKVVNPDGKEGIAPVGYTYNAPPVELDPEIVSITPNVSLVKGGGIVEISGKNFKSQSTVTFGTKTVSLYSFVSEEKIRVKVPSYSSVGLVNVTVTNPSGKFTTLTNGFTYEQPQVSITNLTPNSGPIQGGTLVYIDGVNFEVGATVEFNGVSIPYTYVSSERLRITTPSTTTAGVVSVKVINPLGSEGTSSFTYLPPALAPAPNISALVSNNGVAAGGYNIYVDGAKFVNGTKVIFNGVELTTTFLSTERLRVRVPAGVVGDVLVKVLNPDGQYSNEMIFTYK